MSKERRKVEWSLDLENLRARAGQFVSEKMGEAAEVKRASLRAALEGAASARITLESAVGRTTIGALEADSPDLFQAELSYVGDYEFDVSGGDERRVSLRLQAGGGAELPAMISNAEDLYCHIALARGLPLTLELRGGLGECDIDLSQLQAERGRLRAGLGKVGLTAPLLDRGFALELIGGVGKAAVTIPAGGSGRLTITGGLGAVAVSVAPGAAVCLKGKSGLGKIELPEDFERQSDGSWQTANFAEAERPIVIEYAGGVGSFSLETFDIL